MASNQSIGQSSKKRKAREDKRRKHYSTGTKFLIFFLVLILIGLSIGILFSPAFNLTSVIVEDGVNVSKEEITKVINVNYGENILKQNFKMLKQDVSTLSYISDVNLKIKFPDKIKIEYIEREPYAYVKFLDSYYIVDKFGYVLEILKDKKEKDLPIIYGIDVAKYELGQKLDETSGTKMKNVVSLLETAKQKDFGYDIYEINYESIGEVKIWVKEENVEIIYGEINKNIISEKLNYLEQMLKSITGRKGKLDISDEKYYEKSIFVDINNI